jgi:hypothetical protein
VPADSEQTVRLRELHDAYVWKVNAAVAEGRDDLVRRLSDEYVDEAARLLAETLPPDTACRREPCETCAGLRPRPPPRRRRPWILRRRRLP